MKLFNKSSKKKYIKLPSGGELELDYAIKCATELRESEWESKKYKFGKSLNDKNGGTSRLYVGQTYDPTKVNLIENGWTHDHCEICQSTISEGDSDSDYETEGYSSNFDWICKNCYSNFIEPVDLNTGIKKLNIIEK